MGRIMIKATEILMKFFVKKYVYFLDSVLLSNRSLFRRNGVVTLKKVII